MIDSRRHVRARVRCTTALVIAAAFGASPAALAQDQSAATPADAIFARKTLMDAIGMNMDDITGMLESGKINLERGHAYADSISIMLMAFPHMFPPSTNQWKQGADRDPATDTYASPDVWTNFTDFYKRAGATSKTAYDASRAENEAEFKAKAAELQNGCDGCHAAYMKVDQPTGR
jgi:cytochrome c556